MHRILYTLLVLVAALCLTATFATAQTTQCPAGSKPQTTQQNGKTLTECVPDTSKAPVQTGGCPTGTTAAIDPDTHQFACIPLGNTSADPYTAKRPVLNTDFNATSEQAEVPANLQTLDQQRQQADRVASEQYIINEQSNQNFFETVNTPSRERARKKKERVEQAKLAAEAPGFTVDLGFGYGVIGSIVLHTGVTYIFPNITPIPGKDVRFAAFTDFNFNTIYPNGLTWTVGAKLVTNWSSFQLSVGLGLGITHHIEHYLGDFGINDGTGSCRDNDHSYYNVYGNNRECIHRAPSSLTAFTIKPMIEFDWFLTQHWFVGFAMDLPFDFFGFTRTKDVPDGTYHEYCSGWKEDNCEKYNNYKSVDYHETFFAIQFDLYFHAGYKF